MSTRITTTPRSGIRPLAFQGILATDCHVQIAELVRQRLGEAHARLFAEPAADARPDSIDWYTPLEGTIVPLADLSPEDRAAALTRLGRMGEELRTLAESLKASDKSQQIVGGNLLDLALLHPDESCLYVVDGQPVIVCWGFAPGAEGAPPQELFRLSGAPAVARVASAPVQPAPAADPEPAPQPERIAYVVTDDRGWNWLWLLPLLLALLGLAALLLVSWCGRPPMVVVPGLRLEGPAWLCSSVPDPALDAEMARRDSVLRELEALRQRAELCQPKKLPPLPPAQPAVPPEPVAPPAPVVPPVPEVQRNELEIPEQSRRTGDLGFLRGSWLCEAGLVNRETRKPLVVTYQFDGAGEGRLTIRDGEQVCVAPVTAKIAPSGRLLMETPEVINCPSGTPFSGQSVECGGEGAAASCSGYNRPGGKAPWTAVFQKIQGPETPLPEVTPAP